MVRNDPINRICLIPDVQGVGGMVSFRQKMARGLAERGIEISYHLEDTPYDAILVIGGTRDLAGLWRARRRGVRIAQRLDGINWIHRKRRTGWRHYLRSEYGNVLLSLIRSRLASQIIYQSEFSHQWWERVYGKSHTPWQVVHNGVDLAGYSPHGPGTPPGDHIRILLVEGRFGSGYEWGLQVAVQMGERLAASLHQDIEIMVVGRVTDLLQRLWKDMPGVKMTFTGEVPAERIPELDRSAHVLYAADLNPACPNSVIEALACGLPVAGFDTGALSEIVTQDCGQLVPYGGDPWKLENPGIAALAMAVETILNDQQRFRQAARRRAEEAFGLDHMVDGYLDALQR